MRFVYRIASCFISTNYYSVFKPFFASSFRPTQRASANNRKWQLHIQQRAEGVGQERFHQNTERCKRRGRSHVRRLGEGCAWSCNQSIEIRCDHEHKCCEDIQFVSEKGSHCRRLGCGHCHLEPGSDTHNIGENPSSSVRFQYIRRHAVSRRARSCCRPWTRVRWKWYDSCGRRAGPFHRDTGQSAVRIQCAEWQGHRERRGTAPKWWRRHQRQQWQHRTVGNRNSAYWAAGQLLGRTSTQHHVGHTIVHPNCTSTAPGGTTQYARFNVLHQWYVYDKFYLDCETIFCFFFSDSNFNYAFRAEELDGPNNRASIRVRAPPGGKSSGFW